MIKPAFSIIIPTLNEAKYLPNLLADLNAQSFQDYEVIIVDGQSSDKTVDLARSFTPKLKLRILTSPTRHVCVQRNFGAQHASADYLVFMDADNRLPPYFLQGIKYRLESDPCDLASTYIKPEKDTPQYNAIIGVMNLYYDAENIFIDSPATLESMVIIKNNLFKQIGGFNPNINLGEGRYLTQAVKDRGGIIRIYRDPVYTYSLRRLSHYGSLRTIAAVARNEIGSLFGLHLPQRGLTQKLYPMLGGGVYSSKYQLNKKKIPRFLNNIQKLIQDL